MLKTVDRKEIKKVRDMLELTQKGTVKATVDNYMLVLRYDPYIRESLSYNMLTGRIDIVKTLWWNDEICKLDDDARTYYYYFFERYYSLCSENCMDKALRIEAKSQAYHPICKYLTGFSGRGRIGMGRTGKDSICPATVYGCGCFRFCI